MNTRDIVRAAVMVREADEADLQGVLELYVRSGLETGPGPGPEQARAILRRYAAYPDYRLYVATVGAELAGSFALLIMHKLGHGGQCAGVVDDVAVAPEWQRRGVGRVMMEYARERCAQAGCYKLALSSNARRRKAHAFYRSLGFEAHGVSFAVRP
jgi:GNAT superfamily N-acetyltransferase